MTLQEAIYQVYGVKLALTPTQCLRRVFRINELHNGFLMKIGKTACFGSFIYAEYFIFNEFGLFRKELEHKENKEIRFEWLIWEGARSMLERGERLSRADSERLALAVQRLEMWL
jgi:hypothetical protein